MKAITKGKEIEKNTLELANIIADTKREIEAFQKLIDTSREAARHISEHDVGDFFELTAAIEGAERAHTKILKKLNNV